MKIGRMNRSMIKIECDKMLDAQYELFTIHIERLVRLYVIDNTFSATCLQNRINDLYRTNFSFRDILDIIVDVKRGITMESRFEDAIDLYRESIKHFSLK